MNVIIDRFVGGVALCEKEDKQIISIKRKKLPKEAKEGDVLNVDGEQIWIDKDETDKRRKAAEALCEGLWK